MQIRLCLLILSFLVVTLLWLFLTSGISMCHFKAWRSLYNRTVSSEQEFCSLRYWYYAPQESQSALKVLQKHISSWLFCNSKLWRLKQSANKAFLHQLLNSTKGMLGASAFFLQLDSGFAWVSSAAEVLMCFFWCMWFAMGADICFYVKLWRMPMGRDRFSRKADKPFSLWITVTKISPLGMHFAVFFSSNE